DYVTDVLPVMILIGAGVGISFPALMRLSMSGVRPEEAGLASGLVNTTLQVGAALGLAVLATLASTRTDALHEAGRSTAAALTGGFHLGYLVGAGLVAAAIAVAAVVLQPERRAAAAEPSPGEDRPARDRAGEVGQPE